MHTESWYVQQAEAGTWPDDGSWRREQVTLVCRPNLDVYRGEHGQFVKHYGNLRCDGTDRVLNCAMADGVSSYEGIWFPGEPLLSVQELGAHFGDAHAHQLKGKTRHQPACCEMREKKSIHHLTGANHGQ